MDDRSKDSVIIDRTTKPPGTMPKNAQMWIIVGISVVMVAAIALSGNTAPKSAGTKSPSNLMPQAVADPNAARIAEYRLRIEEQARKLAAEQAALAQSKQALENDLGNMPGVGRNAQQPLPAPQLDEKQQQRRQIEAEREKREYQSLFASNMALTLRRDQVLQVPPTVPTEISGQSEGAPPGVRSPPRTTERAPQAVEESDSEDDGRRTGGRTATATVPPGLQEADGSRYRLFEGTVLEAVLTNRLTGSLAGPVNCMITTDVYSHDHQQLLIPQGTRVLGEVKPVSTFGQQRLAVLFHRLVMPDGFSVSLDQFSGMNQIGETGLRDKVDHHFLQTFGVSIAIGAIAGLAQANTRYGFDVSAADAYRQGVSTSLSQSSLRILDRYLNVLPTFTIKEGHRIKIYLAKDLELPAYDRHKLRSDL